MNNTLAFILIWILLSFPIVYRVNNAMKKAGDETVYKTDFQIFLFIRAQLEVPRFYLITLLYLITHKEN